MQNKSMLECPECHEHIFVLNGNGKLVCYGCESLRRLRTNVRLILNSKAVGKKKSVKLKV